MDAMIEYMNMKYPDEYNLIYSTPSQYIDSLQKHNVSWPTKTDDMFPYSDGPDAYWTGYFTSRANDKLYVRDGSHNFHASNNLYSEKVLDQSITDEQVKSIQEANYAMMDSMGINQHHDAISGTGRQRIADDYAFKIYKSMDINNKVYNELLAEKVQKLTGYTSDKEWVQCLKTNSTYMDCPIANHTLSLNNSNMFAIVQNPSSIDS